MYGLVVLSIIMIYLFIQFALAPLCGYWFGLRAGWQGKKLIFSACFGFFIVFVPVWHKQLPAILVYNYWKHECGSTIYKPFEQWESENSGVLETLKETEHQKRWDEQEHLGDKYPNLTVIHKEVVCGLMYEYCSNGKSRLGWYRGGTVYLDKRVCKILDIWYDIEKQEVLADRVRVYFTFWNLENSEVWYYGPFRDPNGVSFYMYIDYFLKNNKKKQ